MDNNAMKAEIRDGFIEIKQFGKNQGGKLRELDRRRFCAIRRRSQSQQQIGDQLFSWRTSHFFPTSFDCRLKSDIQVERWRCILIAGWRVSKPILWPPLQDLGFKSQGLTSWDAAKLLHRPQLIYIVRHRTSLRLVKNNDILTFGDIHQLFPRR